MSKDPQIVIIDDDEAPREMLRDFCDSMGYVGEAFSDTEEARQYLDGTKDIDLILLDVFIKGKNSLGFMDYLKTTPYAEIPVIIISGATSSEYIQDALSKGVYDFVAKPFTLQQIRERMENALHFCLTKKQNKQYFLHIEKLLKERTKLLEDLAFQSVKALANAIEARDPYTRGHSERVATFAVKIAEAMGFEEEALTKLHLAGLLHDVGKVGVPDMILLKPGRLTEFEYAIMMNHPKMSALIVSEVAPLNSIIPWIKHHHENYDGSGYPEKLSGSAIPPEAQIIAIADNFDALLSVRPYRVKMAKKDVIDYLHTEFGRKFDPSIRKVAIAVLEQTEDKEEAPISISPFIEKFKQSTSYIDYLTGLYWYPYLRSFIEDKIAVNGNFCLIHIDIEGITTINKQLGRIKGDEIIVTTAHTIQKVFPLPEIVVRAGGNDFIVYTVLDLEEASRRIQEVKERLGKTGITVIEKFLFYPNNCTSFDELIAKMQ